MGGLELTLSTEAPIPDLVVVLVESLQVIRCKAVVAPACDILTNVLLP